MTNSSTPIDSAGQTSYFLEHDGKLYDANAIAGYPHGQIPGNRWWTTDDFTGGEASVARHLRDRLGFEMVIRRNADWTRDEVILACDLVAASGWREFRADRPEVIELSRLLRRYWVHPVEERISTFRNLNGVGRKTADIATQNPPAIPERQPAAAKLAAEPTTVREGGLTAVGRAPSRLPALREPDRLTVVKVERATGRISMTLSS